ncbi:MAG: autotransporter-associated beta strand repeat-containing protein, partial [Xanthobacteraceae bacterium]
MTTVFTVTNENELNAAIAAIDVAGADAAQNTTYVINIAAPINLSTELLYISLDNGSSLTLAGTDGSGGAQVQTLDGGGSQRGLSVYNGNVTVENLTIQNMSAVGAAGTNGGGGGGAGLGAGLFVGGNINYQLIGASGPHVTLDNVTFVNDEATGGAGAKFVSGGGGGLDGSFGVGGGGSGSFLRAAGAGGFGAGAGSVSGGGGGLGAGGDIFVQQSGSLTIEGGSLTSGSVTPGLGASGADDGSAFGSGIFIQGNQSITFAPPADQTLTIDDVIADQSGSDGTGSNAGTGGLIVDGAGTVVLDANNTFTGGITLAQGTLVLATVGAAGSGPISFLFGPNSTLEIDNAALTAGATNSFGNTIAEFSESDTLDLPGLSWNPASNSVSFNPLTSALTVTSGSITDVLTLSGTAAGTQFSLVSDGHGGTEIPQTSSNDNSEAALNAEIRAIDVGGADAAPNTAYVINIDGPISLTSDLLAINLDSGSSLTIAGTNGSGGAEVQTLDGGGSQRGFFAYAGTVTLENLTIQNMCAVGGAGGGLGGGGAGLGGGLFVTGSSD